MKNIKKVLILFIIIISILLIFVVYKSKEKESVLSKYKVDNSVKNVVDNIEDNEVNNNITNQQFENNTTVKEKSNNDEVITDFKHLFTTEPNNKNAKNYDYNDIVTINFRSYIDSQSYNEYIVDFKNEKLYYSISPYKNYDVNSYNTKIDLLEKDVQEIKKQIKDANVQNWKEEYESNEDRDTVDGLWSCLWRIILEYNDGTVECHIGHGGVPKGFWKIDETLKLIKNR